MAIWTWDTLTTALDELDRWRREVEEARSGRRTARFFEVLEVTHDWRGDTRTRHVANLIDIDDSGCLVHWLHDVKSIAVYATYDSMRNALAIERTDSPYVLSLVEISEENYNPVRPRLSQVKLNNTQKRILHLLGRGQTNAQIGEALSLSPSSVRNNITKLFRHLQVKTRTSAALLARDMDLTVPDL